jgi:hypothetical protein
MANAPPPEAFQLTLMYFCNGLSMWTRVQHQNSTHTR